MNKGTENENDQGRKNGEEEQNEKEREKENENEKKMQAPSKMPYEIWSHITKDDWEAFVAKKTLPTEVEKRSKASKNASQKKFYHHMGTKTYDESRKEWIDTGFYPISNSSSSAASSSSVTMVKGDRVLDWYCGLHRRDESGRRSISDPGIKKIADAVMGWKRKEVEGEFTPKANMDALHMVLGKECKVRVIGKGGIRLGMRKAFGEEYATTTSSASGGPPQNTKNNEAELEARITQKIAKNFAVAFQQMGLPIPNLELLDDVPEDKFSEKSGSAGNDEIANDVLESPPILEEETPCELLLPRLGVKGGRELVVVAYGEARPPVEGQKVHMMPVEGGHFSVGIDTIESGFEDFSLPIPRPEWSLEKLTDARGSFIAWPCAWVQFSNEVLQKLKKKKVVNINANKEGLQGHERGPPAKGNAISKEKDKEAQSNSTSIAKNTESQRLSSKGSSPKKTVNGTPLVVEQVLDSLSNDCTWLHTCVSIIPDENPIKVGLLKHQFHYFEDAFTWVFKADIREFLTGEMLNVSIIQVFMSALYDDLLGCEAVSKVGWLCPQEIRGSQCATSQSNVKWYIENAISQSTLERKKFIIAPYQQDVMRKLRGRVIFHLTNANPQWRSVKCAQQDNAKDCGYYVMRFMYDVVTSCTDENDLEKVFNTPREEPFTEAELGEVKDKFACFFTNNYID